MDITTVDALRALYEQPSDRAVRKELRSLDPHCRRFVELSPFLVMASVGASGTHDASPRGGAPGFVKVPDENTLLIPDASGNNRLDSLENVVATGRVGLLFLVPGVDESLRVNGRAVLSTDPALIDACRDERRAPKLVIQVTVEEAYLHCAKALMRSSLWDPSIQVDRKTLPSLGEMVKDQLKLSSPAETQEEMMKYYQAHL